MKLWISEKKWHKKTAVIFAVFVAFFIALFFLPDVLQAQQDDTFGVEQVGGQIALAGTDIREVIAKIIRAVLGLLGLIAVGIIIYAGFTIMTSGGQEEKIAKGKKILINGTIGLAIILSAFIIVQFIINALTAGRLEGAVPTAQPPIFETFTGSGSLGHVIQDHYPFRDQTDVPRNTKIVVTFVDYVDPSSMISDSNNSGIFGDCVELQGEDGINEFDCDLLNIEAVQIYKSEEKDSADKFLVDATALAVQEGNEKTKLFTFKPLEPLGSSVEDIWYTVYLTDEIKKDDGETSVFEGQRTDHYDWEFQTGTEFDFTPPHVSATYPKPGAVAPRNSIVQIDFSEAIDPSTVQGILSADSPFSHIIFGDTAVEGEWQITNAYRTVEFLSNLGCGQNSCGENMYCLPIDCPADNNECVQEYTALVRTADLENPQSDTPFFSIAFSGVMDLAGNALDNGPGGQADGIPEIPAKPAAGQEKNISDGELSPDNYWWTFSVQNKIDRTPPYIKQVSPGIDTQGVAEHAQMHIIFSKVMRRRSVSDPSKVLLEEYPANQGDLDDIWFRSYSITQPDNTTKLYIEHREFGPNDLDLYYFPQIHSSVKGINQNCFYPGYGPNSDTPNIIESPICNIDFDEFGIPIYIDANCVPVSIENPDKDTGCPITSFSEDEKAQKDIDACLLKVKDESVSPTFPAPGLTP